MFSIDVSNGKYLRIRATGRLRSSDYDRLEPALEEALALRQAQDRRGGSVRQAQDRRVPLLLDLTGWRGWTVGALVRDLRFDLKHRNSFTRIAVHGDRAWHKWLTLAAKPLFSGPMRYFESEPQAAEWLESGR